MQDEEVACAQVAILSVLAQRTRDGQGPLAPSALVHALAEQGLGEEAARLAMWALIDRGIIALTHDWQVA